MNTEYTLALSFSSIMPCAGRYSLTHILQGLNIVLLMSHTPRQLDAM